MKTLNVLIKPASSLCNLRCRYCFYHDVSLSRDVPSTGKMTLETVDLLIDKIAENLKEEGIVNIAFQGGEPCLVGLEWFEHFVSKMQNYPNIQAYYSLQTNAMLLDEAWANFFFKHDFLIGVSLDAYQSNTDEFRYDVKHKSVYTKILQGIDYLKKANVDYNILTVLTQKLAQDPKGLLDWALELNIDYLQLIPCLPGFDEKENSFALRPKDYAKFYLEFFSHWKKAVEEGHFININLFENLAGIIKGYPPYQCGLLGQCTVQFIVEGNGDVYPCDFFCLDEYCMGNLKDFSLEELSKQKGAIQFLKDNHCQKKPCKSCPFISICHGGCRRQNVCYLEEDYCAYQEVLSKLLPQLREMMRK